jgi:hypothetical protein
MQARYRPSMGYLVSVVLIQSEGALRSALPVIKRGPADRGPDARGAPLPTLISARAAATPLQPALRLGDDVLFSGTNLLGSTFTVLLEQTRLGIQQVLTPKAIDDGQVGAHISSIGEDANGMNTWAAGVYSASLLIAQPSQPKSRTNSVPVALAPIITVSPLSAAAGTISLTVTCTPRIRPEQEANVRLVFGDSEITPATISTPGTLTLPTTLTFSIPSVTAGDYVVRLRVEGIDSLPVVLSGTPPTFAFDTAQTVHVT